MDKSIPEWQRRFRGMDPKTVENAWAAKSTNELTWTHECFFHAAAAERMKQLGNMAIDLDDGYRLKLCRQAQDILARLQRYLSEEPEKLDAIQKHAAESDAYYAKFGTRTARYYLFEQGAITELGDRRSA